MLWPGFPIAYSPYRSKWAKKRVQISFTGTNHRNRSTYRDGAVRAGIEVPDLMHNRNNPNNSIQKYSEYLRPLKFSKFAFSNGYLSSVESIIVGRALESLACGSVLLYEAGSDLNFFFSEYQDFVPILNVPDLIEKVYFLSENDTLAQTIADNGQKKMLSEFSSSNFWELVLRRLS
jgi:spore maturation protein CgeB